MPIAEEWINKMWYAYLIQYFKQLKGMIYLYVLINLKNSIEWKKASAFSGILFMKIEKLYKTQLCYLNM